MGIVRSQRTLNWRPWLGGVLFLGGVGVTIWLAVVSSDPKTATLINVLLVLLAAVLQGASVLLFNSVGRADPALARASVRDLLRLAERASEARVIAEDGFEQSKTQSVLKGDMGRLSSHLSYLEDGFISGADNWAQFHPEAFKLRNAVDNAVKDQPLRPPEEGKK